MTERTKKRKILVALTVVIFIALGAFAAFYLLPLKWNDHDFRYAGTLEATRVDVSTRIPSVIMDVAVREGERVGKNQTLVSLSCEDVQLASDLAKSNFERAERLRKSGALTQEAYELNRNKKDEASLRVSWCQISSPIEGVVMNRYFEPGEWVGPGMKLLSVANLKDISAYIYVPKNEVHRLRIGQDLVGILSEMPEREFVGTISRINDEAEFTPKNIQTRTERERLIYGVKIDFSKSNGDEILKPGMTIEVSLPKG